MNVTRQSSRRASILRVLAVLSGLCLLAVGLVAFMVYRTVTVGADVRTVRNIAFNDLDLRTTSRVEVSAHPLLVGLARFGISFAPLEPEARLAIQAVRGGEVGVYQLTSTPDARQRQTLFTKVDQRLEKRGWNRTVAVLDGETMVMVYTPDEEMESRKVEAFVLVLNERELVLVLGRGNLDPVVELLGEKLGKEFPLPVFAQWRN